MLMSYMNNWVGSGKAKYRAVCVCVCVCVDHVVPQHGGFVTSYSMRVCVCVCMCA